MTKIYYNCKERVDINTDDTWINIDMIILTLGQKIKKKIVQWHTVKNREKKKSKKKKKFYNNNTKNNVDKYLARIKYIYINLLFVHWARICAVSFIGYNELRARFLPFSKKKKKKTKWNKWNK